MIPGGIALLVGNGLAIDFCNFAGSQMHRWDPRKPLSWSLGTPGAPDIPLLDSLPRLAASLREPRLKALGSDFARFGALSKRFAPAHQASRKGARSSDDSDLSELAFLEFQVRYFLAVAFSQFQDTVDTIPLFEWSWLRWIQQIRSRLVEIVSFNYDLIVESACECAGLIPYRFQAGERVARGGVPVFKPHGSIDFDVSSNVLNLRWTFPLGNVAINGCDYPVEVIPRNRLLAPRTAADIVLPFEYSVLSNVQWVAPGYSSLPDRFRRVDQLVLLGLSFSDVDRAEILYIIDAVPSEADIVVANPDPPHDLLNALDERGRFWTIWKSGPAT
jgi:hypothetical protein